MSSNAQISITAVFQDQASQGLRGLQQQLGATSSAATRSYGGLQTLNTNLGAIGRSATTAQTEMAAYQRNLGGLSTASGAATQSTVGLGTKIGLLSGFAATTAVAGLVSGYYSLNAAQVAVERHNWGRREPNFEGLG